MPADQTDETQNAQDALIRLRDRANGSADSLVTMLAVLPNQEQRALYQGLVSLCKTAIVDALGGLMTPPRNEAGLISPAPRALVESLSKSPSKVLAKGYSIPVMAKKRAAPDDPSMVAGRVTIPLLSRSTRSPRAMMTSGLLCGTMMQTSEPLQIMSIPPVAEQNRVDSTGGKRNAPTNITHPPTSSSTEPIMRRPIFKNTYYSKRVACQWERAPQQAQLVLSHIGRIEETDAGMVAPQACDSCFHTGQLCKVYKPEASNKGSGQPTLACAGCRFYGPVGGCSFVRASRKKNRELEAAKRIKTHEDGSWSTA